MAKAVAMVELTGWLNDVKQFSWGRALKVTIDQRKRNAKGEWETVEKTLYDVTTDSPVMLDGVKQVTVTGRIIGTSTFQKRDGSTGSAIRVRAESVVPAVDGSTPQKSAVPPAVQTLWPDVKAIPEDNAPF